MQNDVSQTVTQTDVSTCCPGSLQANKWTGPEFRAKQETNGDVPPTLLF